MILTKEKILAEIQFVPELDSLQVSSHSIDLRLAENHLLMPGVYTMMSTLEEVTLPDDVMGVVFPRSSTNRRFIALDMTGVVDAGYQGHLVLPLTNCNIEPIQLYRGERIAQMVFHRLEQPAVLKLSKYHKGDGNYVPDKERELDLVKQGMIQELKAEFPLPR